MMKFGVKLLIVFLIGLGAYLYFTQDRTDYHPTVAVDEVSYQESQQPEQMITDQGNEAAPTEETAPDFRPQDSVDLPEESAGANGQEIPLQFNLAVPFTSQAPTGNWDMPYQEACEEASSYMVAEYYKGTPSGKIDPNVADAAILAEVAFEEDYLGTYLDTTAEQTAGFIGAYFGLHAEVIENPTVDQIKAEIAAGRPVIVPAAGRELGNPNFTGIGPLYHMLVIKGYTEDQFITNDPGTRNGESYVYDIDVLMNAIGDWNGGDPANGAKRVIFVSP